MTMHPREIVPPSPVQRTDVIRWAQWLAFGAWFALLVVLLLCDASRATADEAATVRAADKAFAEGQDFPWFDAKKGDLRDVTPPRQRTDDSETRATGWQGAVDARKKPPPVRTGPWFTGPGWSMFGQTLAVVLLVIAIGILLYLLGRYFFLQEEFESDSTTISFKEDDGSLGVDRVEQLPFTVENPLADPLATARQLYSAGRYREAIVYLFAYQLMLLDRHQLIHLAKGKTNRQYLREVRKHEQLQPLIYRTMVAFEDVFFGQHPLPQDRFEACWHQVGDFQRLVEQAGAAS